MNSLLTYILLLFYAGILNVIGVNSSECGYKLYQECEGWLKYHEVPMTWREARLTCQYEGAVLASPTQLLLNTMSSIISSNKIPSGKVFTGIHATFLSRHFSTIEGIPLLNIPHEWAEGEPNNERNPEDCLSLNQNGTLADLNCDATLPFICYKKKEGVRFNDCGTFDDEYALSTKTGSCYKFHSFPHSWDRAYMICQAEGGHLAVINNEVEAQVMKDILATYPPNVLPPGPYKGGALIGFREIDEHGLWVTVQGADSSQCSYKLSKECECWLKFHDIPKTWKEARLTCQYEGAILASPTPDLLSAMTSIISLNKIPSGQVFTGIQGTFFSRYLSTIEGIPLSNIPHEWVEGEPNNDQKPEDCISLNQNGTLADLSCDTTLPFICYKKKEGFNLNDCGTFDKEYALSTKTGSCYKFHRYPHSWGRANMICQAEGGHLAVINSEREAQVMRDILATYPPESLPPAFDKGSALIGFRDIDERGLWITVQGQTLEEAGYDRFSEGQPDNWGPGQNCGSIFRSGLLDDVDCELRGFFICEKDPDSKVFCDS